MKFKDLRLALEDWDPLQVDNFIAKSYPSYWLNYGRDVHVRHANIVRLAKLNNENLYIDTRVDEEFEYTEITVYTPDHPGIFSQIAGAVALLGATIMDAKIVTMSDGMVMDSFSILDINNQAYNQPRKLERLKERIIESLSGKIYLKKELAKLRKSHMSRKEDSFNVAPRIIFDNKASTTDTVIEVNGRDRIGFLYEVTSAINELGLKINSAHITTYGEHVVDTFYIKDIFGLKIEHDVKIERIRKQLIKVVESRPKEYKTSSL